MIEVKDSLVEEHIAQLIDMQMKEISWNRLSWGDKQRINNLKIIFESKKQNHKSKKYIDE